MATDTSETIEWFQTMVEIIKDYESFCAPNHNTYGLWYDVDYHGNFRGIIIYTINEHGGSRNTAGFVMADDNEKSLRRFSNAMFPVRDYVTPEEEERMHEQQEIFNSFKTKMQWNIKNLTQTA